MGLHGAANTLPMNRNSQTRMTNDEIRRNDQTRMDETGDCTTQRIWTFELRISFVIRHSSFNDLCKSGSWSHVFEKTKGRLSMKNAGGRFMVSSESGG